MIKKFVSSILATALFVMMSGIFNPFIVAAASITSAKDVLSRQKASTASDHTFTFVLPGGLTSGQNMTLTFQSGFTGVGSMIGADFDFAEGSTGVCSSATFTEKSVVTSGGSASQFNIAGAGQVVTITSGGASATITAGRCIRLKAGLNATDTTGSGPGTHQITNGTLGNYTISVAGSIADTGTIVDIIDDNDQVTVMASVDEILSFDLDTGTTNAENGPNYSVAFGTISASTVKYSDHSAVNSIWASGGTNSSGGMNVTVQNANGANGLKSTTVPGDYIQSTTASMAVGSANYGLCVTSTGLAGWIKAAGTYDQGTCTTASGTNAVRALTTTTANILTSSGPTASATAEIVANAEISTATPAHTDYTDTLTFIATASF
jgi:hypothetical protein